MRAHPSPRECSEVGNRKLVRFSWVLCQPSPSPEDKALHRDGVSFTPLTDQSREEKEGGWPCHKAGSPSGTVQSLLLLRTQDAEPRDSEHDAHGVCDKYLLNELMSPLLCWEPWPEQERNHHSESHSA